MKMPVIPPNIQRIMESIVENDIDSLWLLMSGGKAIDSKGRYLHWDKLRHLPIPDDIGMKGITHEQWWMRTKKARQEMYAVLPLKDKTGMPFQVATPAPVLRVLHWLDRYAAGNIQSNDAITNAQTRNTYLIRSLIEEAINSSQLEGAATTRDDAKEMIRQARSPKDKSEQMILNNYHAMQFIGEIKEEELTPAMVLELHKILTLNTLDSGEPGKFRASKDNIHVVDNATQEYLHTPPAADQLQNRMKLLCEFANQDEGSGGAFFHPVIRAIALHFMLAYDHPFCDGNGRTARALFYWAMAKQGYWLMEFISISRVIKKAPVQYGKSFLYTETDDSDLTYFVIHQLEIIREAVEDLHTFLDEKTQGINEAERLLVDNPRLQGKLNFRQLALLRHALKYPRFSYIVQEHQRSHGISYDVARKDLLEMSDKLNLLIKSKQGRQYFFVAPSDLESRVAQR